MLDGELFAALYDPQRWIASKVVRQLRGGGRKGVRHQQTCPECGRQLVNLYVGKDGEWKCKKCWEADVNA